MIERFIKVQTCVDEYVALQATPQGRYTLTTSDGIESSAVELSLEQFRQLLVLFPEFTRPAALEERP